VNEPPTVPPKILSREGLYAYVTPDRGGIRGRLRHLLRHGLGRTGPGARDLDRISDAELAHLSAGTGVPVEQLQGMRTGATMARVNERIQGLLLTEGGRAALDQLRVSLSAVT